MAGHSKWHSIRHKKGAADAKRGKVFTMHAKLISIAARSGADPDMNPALRTAIDRAKADNVPNANIDRAIKKGSGQDKDAAQYTELTYEAMGPDGSAFMIDVITDNKNRSLTNVKMALNKNGGTLASAGSVAWQFEKKAYFLVSAAGKDADEAELELMDCGVDEIERGEEGFELYAAPDQYGEVKKALLAAGFTVDKDALVWKAKDEKSVSDVALAQKILKLMEKIEDDDDVSQVYSNVDFDASVLAALG